MTTMKNLFCLGLMAITPAFIACGDPPPQYGEFDIIADADPNFDPTQPLTRQSRYFILDQNRTLVVDTNVTLLQEPSVGLGLATVSDMRAKELTPGDAVTLWWALFTIPDACRDGLDEQGTLCGPEDLRGIPAVEPQFGYAGPAPMGGAIVDPNGEVVFPGSLSTPVVDENSPANPDFLIGNGLTDLYGTEIHLIIRTHGPALGGGLQDSQLSSFDGGCLDGEPNQGMCLNIQSAFFPPLQAVQ